MDPASVEVGQFVVYVLVFIAIIALALLAIDYVRRKKLLQERISELVMLEVKVPPDSGKKEDEPTKTHKDYMAMAEQFFSSLSNFYDNRISSWWYGQPVFSFEIISKDKQIGFYVGTPRHFHEAIEKQILSFFPNAQVDISNDFKLFEKDLHASVGVLDLNRQFIYPLKTYNELDAEPLGNLTNVLSRLGENTNAGIQVLLRPHKGGWRSAINHAVEQLRSGKTISGAASPWIRGLHNVTNVASSQVKNPESQEQASSGGISPIQQAQLELIQKKGQKDGFDVQIRIIALGDSYDSSIEDVRNIFASFAQFGTPDRNGLRLHIVRSLNKYLPYYILRHFTRRHVMLLNTEELATIFHFPNQYVDTPGIKWLLAKKSGVPSSMPKEGIILGENIFRGERTLVRIKEDDRRRHLYAIGMTGTGKSTFFESMALQDIREDRGVAVFDPHGAMIESILSRIPKSRADDVIYFDPADRYRPFGLNLLEWQTPEQKDFLVQETVQIFYKLFDPNSVGFIGPQFEHWMRNAALTLMESEGGGTLIEIPRLFVDENFRKEKIAQLKDPVVKAFWEKQLAQTADFHKSEMYNYFISKFGRFMTNDIMRNIMGQAKSSFDLRQLMDSKKILLVNLSKGRVGEVNSNLLGMILVARLFTAALSRQDQKIEVLPDFYLYVDEFQNFATETFSSILSEARKYRLNLNITNQYIAQLPEPIRDAIIGNAGTIISFRVGVPDAEFMAQEFAPKFTQRDLNNIEAFNCYVKLLIDNTPSRPFSMRTIKDAMLPNTDVASSIKKLSAYKYGRDKVAVDEEVALRTKGVDVPMSPSGSVPIEK